MSHDVKEVIAGYIKLRDQKEALQREQKEAIKPFNEKMQTMENWLLGELTKSGLDSMTKKGVGTVFTSTRTSSKVVDWDETLPFIKDHELWHMLERRVSKTALEEYIDANGESLPGVSISREISVNVRRVQN